MRSALVIALLALAACAPQGEIPGEPVTLDCQDSAAIGVAYGARIVATAGAEFPIDRTGLTAETARAIEVGARVWGVPESILDGWTVSYQGGWFACRADAWVWTWGCAYLGERTIYAAPGPSGCRAAVLVHEIGHVAIPGGDGGHTDSRWAVATAVGDDACSGLDHDLSALAYGSK